MKSLKKIIILLVLSVSIFSFIKKEKKELNLELNKKELNVIDILKKQKLECRPSSDFFFYVETNVVKKIRGANTVNAKVFIEERASGKTSVLASRKVQVLKYEGAISIDNLSDSEYKVLPNGDKVINSEEKNDYSFEELIKYESIYNSYVKSTSSLKN